MKTTTLIPLLLIMWTISNEAFAEPYDWCKSKFIDCDNSYEETNKIYTKKNPYEPGLRHTNSRGNVWYTEQDPYQKDRLRTRPIR